MRTSIDGRRAFVLVLGVLVTTSGVALAWDTAPGIGEPPGAAGAKPVPLGGPVPEAFAPFSETVTVRAEDGHLVVESNAMPEHPMMVGIRAWQQQVPLPQPFVGENAWRLPRTPRMADEPISVLREPLRGAIALAVNGVPIFCALNNRGDDTYLAGELDDWGGHCGRGDDYHYHIAPVHLEERVGTGNPVGYALDGFPILGFTEADGSPPATLDEFNGHAHADGHYHYHATKSFPYVNGGLRGVVTMRGDQIEQPRDAPVRPGQPPLRGATITAFDRDGDEFDLAYEIDGRTGHVRYAILDDDRVRFTYVAPSGATSTAEYERGRGGGGWTLTTVLLVAISLVIVTAAAAMLLRRRAGSP